MKHSTPSYRTEKIARIIDPDEWYVFDTRIVAGVEPPLTADQIWEMAQRHCKSSIAKVPAVAAILASIPVQGEVVAWQRYDERMGWCCLIIDSPKQLENWRAKGVALRPLYAAPPVQGEAVAVPKEPTQEMILAGAKAGVDQIYYKIDAWTRCVEPDNREDWLNFCKFAYRAMLEAAPRYVCPSDQGEAVAVYADDIDRLLQHDPKTPGLNFGGDYKLLFESLLEGVRALKVYPYNPPSPPVQGEAVALELAEFIGRYFSETVYLRTLSFSAAEFVAKRGCAAPHVQTPAQVSGTFLGYWNAQGNEMHCKYKKCPDTTFCRNGCMYSAPRPTPPQGDSGTKSGGEG